MWSEALYTYILKNETEGGGYAQVRPSLDQPADGKYETQQTNRCHRDANMELIKVKIIGFRKSPSGFKSRI